MARTQVNVYVEDDFLQIVDKAAGLTGSTRSDFVRIALLRYSRELLGEDAFNNLRQGEQ